MDIFGKKKIAEQADEIRRQDDTIKYQREQIKELSKLIEDHKNRYRTFQVTFEANRPSMTVKCRRFDHNLNGYFFYEMDATYSGIKFHRVEGYLVGHIPARNVANVFETDK